MPVTEIPTDLLTPLGAYLTVREEAAGAFLLESVERGRLGRYSFVGAGSQLVTFEVAETLGEPVVGYLGYDAVATFEPTVPLPEDGPDVPESVFLVPDVLLRFDHARGVAELLRGDAHGLTGAAPPLPRGSTPRGPLEREPSREEHLRRVERAQEHIREGDVFQVVIAQRAKRPTSASAVELYRALRRVNPSPYLFLLELGDLALVGSSPETVVKCTGRRAELNPIAGTIAPGEGDAAALLSSEKDRAEHTMLVDLGRNDLSRVCLPGSVQVKRFMEPERYSHVTHLVSEVVGDLRDGVTPFELLRACFPAGTVSGAPKVRAMQIISELEGHRRGIYAGAVGYFLPAGLEASPAKPATPGRKTALPLAALGGELDTCIAIRTLWLRDGVAHLQAGGGIVADSDPATEHEECLAKLRALETAIELAESEQDGAQGVGR
jgi:anthranilate synthase component 1